MCKENQIALTVINSLIDSGESFTYDHVIDEILTQGGILRISIGITIRMYLRNLNEIGLLAFDPVSEQYSIIQNALLNHHIMA